MTSKQWAEVSIAFDTPPGERTERQKMLADVGLYDPHSITGDTLRASLAALFAAMSQRERREVLGGDF